MKGLDDLILEIQRKRDYDPADLDHHFHIERHETFSEQKIKYEVFTSDICRGKAKGYFYFDFEGEWLHLRKYIGRGHPFRRPIPQYRWQLAGILKEVFGVEIDWDFIDKSKWI